MFDQPEVQFARDVVSESAQLARQIQREMITPALTKQDRSPVTVADFAVQAIVGRRLSESFPDDSLVGEEDAGALRGPDATDALAQVTKFVGSVIRGASPEDVCTWIDRGGSQPADRFWTVDPIDGTKGFLRGEQYAVALALIVDGKVQVAALGCPNLVGGQQAEIDGPGSVVVAAAGRGVWATPLSGDANPVVELHVSQRSTAEKARLLRSVESAHTDGDKIGELTEVLGVRAEPVRLDSQAKYSVLAAGGGDVLLRLLSPKRPDYREMIWDQAAGSLVIEEAGGRITDLDGKPLDFTQGRTLAKNRGVLATNGLLHDKLLAGLRSISA